MSIYLKPTAYAAVAVGLGLAVSSLPLFTARPLIRVAIIGAFEAVAYTALVKRLAPDVWNQLRDRIRGAPFRRVAA
jgi:hypothetical protein